MSQTNKKIQSIVLSLIASVLLCTSLVYAQIPGRAELEAQLKNIENEINSQKSAIKQKQQEAASISRDVSILGSKVSNSQARIKAQSLQINNLSGDINEKVGTIKELTAKTTQQKLAIGQILRKKNELDGSSFAEFILSQKTFTEFFADEDSYTKF
jgi:septal ring factor EnvC (AmiA/AmiB activator)